MVAPHTSPIQPSLYAVIKFHTTSYPPSRLTNSDQVPILGFGVCRTFRENGSNLNKGDSGDFCDLFTTPWALYEYSEIGRPWSADVWTKKISSRNRRNCMNMVSGKSGKIPRGLSMWSRNHTFLLGTGKGSTSNWPLEKIWIKWRLCTCAHSQRNFESQRHVSPWRSMRHKSSDKSLTGICITWDLGFIIICATSAGCKRIEIYSTSLTLTSPQMLISWVFVGTKFQVWWFIIEII